MDDHSSDRAVTDTATAANPDLLEHKRLRRLPGTRSLFGVAPGGACHAATVASSAVGSYPTVSPLPVDNPQPSCAMTGGLISVALSVGLPRPGVTRHHSLSESGLSSPCIVPRRDVTKRPSSLPRTPRSTRNGGTRSMTIATAIC